MTSVLDGGDHGCGELLLELRTHIRGLPPGAVVRLIATDPAAPDDLPRWCRMTGHRYVGPCAHVDGRPAYDIETHQESPG